MKRNLLFWIGLLFSVMQLQAQVITYTTTTTPVTCQGGNDGSATITSISGGVYFNTSTKGLLISEIYADPTGVDSAYEFVELVVTRFIDFSATPYTVIVCNNNIATTSGWVEGVNKTYAFLINSGTVNAGDVVYVGGSTMIPQTNRIRFINVVTTTGDGGIGNAATGGVIGNGGANCDGVAVFNLPIASIDSSTVPIDAVFFGSGTNSAVVLAGAQGYQLPNNDYYSGGKLLTASYIAPDPPTSYLIKASFGIYNVATNTFTTPRTWIATPNANFTNLATSLLIDALYNVSWSNSVTSVYNPNLTAGLYSFTIFDQIANMAAGSVNVADGQIINLNATATDALACVGDTIGLSAQNADVYSWTNGGTLANTQIIASADSLMIVLGTDTITGCSSSDSVFIDVNAYPVVVFSMTNDTICNNGGNISLSGTPVGGTYVGTGVTGSTLDPLALSGTNNITYTYTDGNGCSDNDIANYLVINCLGLEDLPQKTVNIYPNPANEFIWVSTDQMDMHYSIMDLSGKVVAKGNLNNEKKVDVQGLTTGIYILTLQNNTFSKQIKLIKR